VLFVGGGDSSGLDLWDQGTIAISIEFGLTLSMRDESER